MEFWQAMIIFLIGFFTGVLVMRIAFSTYFPLRKNKQQRQQQQIDADESATDNKHS